MNLLFEFQHFIKKENLFQPKDKLLLAVSGGVDSVVLCELCKQAGYDFVIAHCNFQLRGEESQRDEDFVNALGKKYAVEVLVKKFDTEKYAADNKVSIQVAARELRYSWFRELVANRSLNIGHWIVTAHHANDNVETMLMNFFKGTGINGLKAILPKQGNIVRPLLFARKEELIAFAQQHKLGFVEDSSNASGKYTRNYFRNELIPAIEEVFPRVEENLMDNLHRFREIEILYQQSVDLHKKKLLEQKGNEIHIPVLKLQKTEPLHTIVYEIIRDFGFTTHQTDEVIGLLQSETGKYIRSSSHRIIKNRNWLIISPNETVEAATILLEGEGSWPFAAGNLELKKIPTTNLPTGQAGHKPQTTNFKPQTSNNIAQLDATDIKFPLLLRKWKQGDYFYPLGMNKKKKLSRFLIDQKLSMPQKENTWVIEMNKKIIWIIGLRIDDRFKLTAKTNNLLQLKYSPAE